MTADDLVEVLDRVITAGVVVHGDVLISLAGVDLIRLDLRALLAAVDTLEVR
ncbi:gas vesicle protein GvpJ [Kutzneria sp. NPDC051319]|uniref:gas vesicle protein GvpJ n=1 Tax=Kutzneria sp. NPDC051319 TaxID=3155047 RepID=UPI0034487D11